MENSVNKESSTDSDDFSTVSQSSTQSNGATADENISLNENLSETEQGADIQLIGSRSQSNKKIIVINSTKHDSKTEDQQVYKTCFNKLKNLSVNRPNYISKILDNELKYNRADNNEPLLAETKKPLQRTELPWVRDIFNKNDFSRPKRYDRNPLNSYHKDSEKKWNTKPESNVDTENTKQLVDKYKAMRISSSTNKIAIKVTDLKSIKEKSDQTTVMTVNNSSYRFQNASFTNNTRSPGTYKSNYFGERQNLPRKPFHNNRSRATASAQAPFPREFAQTTYSPGNYYTSYTPPISYQYPVYSRPQNTYAYSAYSEFTPYYSSQEYNYPANYSRIPYQGEGYIPSPYDSNYAYGPNQNIYYPPPDYNTYNNPDGT